MNIDISFHENSSLLFILVVFFNVGFIYHVDFLLHNNTESSFLLFEHGQIVNMLRQSGDDKKFEMRFDDLIRSILLDNLQY